jgi:uncharacterized membrane protein YfcA
MVATAIFTGTIFVWTTDHTQRKAAKILGSVVTILCLMGWMIARVNSEELILVCLPASMGFGVLASCLLGRSKKTDTGFIDEKIAVFDV